MENISHIYDLTGSDDEPRAHIYDSSDTHNMQPMKPNIQMFQMSFGDTKLEMLMCHQITPCKQLAAFKKFLRNYVLIINQVRSHALSGYLNKNKIYIQPLPDFACQW